LRRFFEIIESPEHILLLHSRDYINAIRNVFIREKLPFPLQLFDDNYADVWSHYLTKKNFPYMEKVDQAIMIFYENGFLRESIFIRDGVEDG